jgi:cyclopropane fatty-acyl-phospholipid synthase-like methyltransferase
MAEAPPRDRSNGYDRIAGKHMRLRSPQIGVAAVLEWSAALPPGSSILDLGCGHGVPVSQA